MQVVLVFVAPRKVALRTSSGGYGGRIKYPDKECHGHVGQLAAVGNLPVVELLVEAVEYLLRNIEPLFSSAMGGKRVGHRAGTIVSVVLAGSLSLTASGQRF